MKASLRLACASDTMVEQHKKLVACASKYHHLGKLARDTLEEEALRQLQIKVVASSIDAAALTEIEQSWAQIGRKVPFDWKDRILPILRKSHPRRLELALRASDGSLCGVAVARLSDSRKWISITHIEGSPLPSHPLRQKVVPLTLLCCDIYSVLVQDQASMDVAPSVRIMNPLANSIAWYAKCGYSQLVQRNGYSFAVINQGVHHD